MRAFFILFADLLQILLDRQVGASVEFEVLSLDCPTSNIKVHKAFC